MNFDEDHLMTVVVGRNGSGKSNVLEALVLIFRNLDLGEPPPFSYKLQYSLGEENWERWLDITIDADPPEKDLPSNTKSWRKTKNETEATFKPLAFSKVKRDKKTKFAYYLPNFCLPTIPAHPIA